MPFPPIVVQLSKFEHIEILRAEIATREEELKQVEKQVRVVLFELERQAYLQGLHPFFQNLQPHPDVANLDLYSATRDSLGEAIQSMKAALNALEAETTGQVAPPSRGLHAPRAGTPSLPPSPKRARFDSFDDFKSNRQGN